jgi:hypothetical protein
MAHVSRLMGHLRHGHEVREAYAHDLVQFFKGTILPGRLKFNLQRTNEAQVHGKRNVERCHSAGCRNLHAAHNRIERHSQKHSVMRANIQALAWLWDTIRTIIRERPRATIAEVLGEGEAYQCPVPQHGQILANQKASRPMSHGTMKHCSKEIGQPRGAN